MLLFFTFNLSFLSAAYIINDVPPSNLFFFIFASLILLANIAICGLIFFAKSHAWPIEKIFLIIGSSLGIMYLFAIPIGRAPDEPIHIWKVYSIAQGNILTEKQNETNGNFLPQNIATLGNSYTDNAYNQLSERLSEPTSEEQIFQETLGSNPIDYLPHIIGVLLGRLLHLPMLPTLYLARFCNLAFCIIIIYFCIKHIPILKKPLLFISCIPLSMQTFIAISYDGVIFCSAIAILTLILYSVYQKSFKFTIWHYCISTALCIALTAVKPVYFPLCLLLFYIPTQCFKHKKQKILILSSILLLTIISFILWSSLSIVTQPGNGADSTGQISYIVAHPIHYIVILIHNIFDTPLTYLHRLGILEWLDVPTNQFYIVGTLIFFTILCINERLTAAKNKLPKNFRLSVLFTITLSTILIFTALYIQWTPVGAYNIEGVQTRYLLPIAILIPLLCIPFNKQHKSTPKKTIISSLYLYSFIIFLNFNAILTLLCAHS